MVNIYYFGVKQVLQMCYSGIIGVLQLTGVLEGSYRGVIGVVDGWYIRWYRELFQ